MPSEKQINRWLIGAIVPPLIMVAAGEPWTWLLGVTVLCGIAAFVSGGCVNKWGVGMQWLASLMTLAILLPYAQQCWPSDPHPAVPLILLALSVWAAGKGLRAAAGVACVLFWFITIMYGAMAAALIPQAQVRWSTSIEGEGSWIAVLLLLIPAAPLARRKHSGGLVPGIIVTAVACLTASVLAGNIHVENPFYEAVRSVKVRLEPILGAAATAGWFLLITLLLSVNGVCAERIHEKIRLPGILVGATAAAVCLLCELHIPAWIGVVSVTISWVFLPALTQLLESRKKMKKSEKTY